MNGAGGIFAGKFAKVDCRAEHADAGVYRVQLSHEAGKLHVQRLDLARRLALAPRPTTPPLNLT